MKRKQCAGCRRWKSASEFYAHHRRGLQDKCKACKAEYNRAHYLKNKERYLASASRTKAKPGYRDMILRQLYGIDQATYDRMFEHQGGVCAICATPPSNRRRLCVDHCHSTNVVRGLLCDRCNTGLSWFSESRLRLLAAAKYLGSGSGATALSKSA